MVNVINYKYYKKLKLLEKYYLIYHINYNYNYTLTITHCIVTYEIYM